MFFNGILALLTDTLLAYENRKLDKQYGTIEEQKNRIAATEGSKDAVVEATVACRELGPMYRYVFAGSVAILSLVMYSSNNK